MTPQTPSPRLHLRTRMTNAATTAVAFLLFATLTACGGASAAAASSPAQPTRTGVSFELPSDGGQLVPIPQPSSRVTVIDAFGPTCAPCREKLPALLARRGEIEAAGGKLVLVAVLGDGESTDDAAKALASWGASSPFLVDRGAVLLRELGLRGLPGTYVLDRDGAVRWESTPESTEDDVVAAAKR